MIKEGDLITYSSACTTRVWWDSRIIPSYFPAKVVHVGMDKGDSYITFVPKNEPNRTRRWSITNVMLEEEEN